MLYTHPADPGTAALRYVAAGVPVLALYEITPTGHCACGEHQCTRRGKHPRTPHGHLGATTDPATVAKWWWWWPHANVGAATGSMFDVWDIDLPEDQADALRKSLDAAVQRGRDRLSQTRSQPGFRRQAVDTLSTASDPVGSERTGPGLPQHPTAGGVPAASPAGSSASACGHADGQTDRHADRHNGSEDGRDSAAGGPVVRTGGGGTHVFYAPTGTGCRTKFLPGCDWRGIGGYVVLPPSNHESGHPYTWLAGQLGAAVPGNVPAPVPGVVPVLPSVPGPLLARLRPAALPQPTRATPRGGWHAHRGGYASAALSGECQRLAAMAADSGRNHALNQAAFNLGQLVGAGQLDRTQVEAELTAAARSCGLGNRETARTIASGLAAGIRHPRAPHRLGA